MSFYREIGQFYKVVSLKGGIGRSSQLKPWKRRNFTEDILLKQGAHQTVYPETKLIQNK